MSNCLESSNGAGTCYPQVAPTAELKKLIQTQQLSALRLQVAESSYYHANPCTVANLKELCADSTIAPILTIYQVDEYGFPNESTCAQSNGSCVIH